MDVKSALENREAKKKRKPIFKRTDWHKRSRVGRGRKKLQVWRRARGRHNKIREQRISRMKRPEIGYGSPRLVKGTISGLKPVNISTLNELEKLNKDNIAIINSVLGMRKRIMLFNKAKELGIKTNLPEDFPAKFDNFLKEKKLRRIEFEKSLKEKEEKKKIREKEEKAEEQKAKEKVEEKAKEETAKEVEKEKEIKKVVPIEKPHDVKTKVQEKKGVGYHRQALDK